MKKVFVAETDETGRIEWVWLWRAGQRGPRMIRKAEDCSQMLDHAEFHGSSRDNIVDWLARRA
ncbi:hypothetical protein [Albibacillus kandeliae]|uniref:hypothetical protein n=1 Tax=Albibacillus kandeliae TaxID=2174228 RepID=UPI000D69819D|nr:hypothetical protein [Albibacillus kandeliae]